MEGLKVRSRERRRTLGEVFTPPALVDEMLDRLPPELFTSPERTFLDPSCGNGNFLVAVVERKIAGGSSPVEALSTTYGVDIDETNVLECRERLLARAEEVSQSSRDESWTRIVAERVIIGDALDPETWRRFGRRQASAILPST